MVFIFLSNGRFPFQFKPQTLFHTPHQSWHCTACKQNCNPRGLRFVHQAKRVRSWAWGTEKSRQQHFGGCLEENTVSCAMDLIGLCFGMSESKSTDWAKGAYCDEEKSEGQVGKHKGRVTCIERIWWFGQCLKSHIALGPWSLSSFYPFLLKGLLIV